MFKRISNLLTLSKYSVEEDLIVKSDGYMAREIKLVKSVPNNKKPATIVDDAYNPLSEFKDETN